MTFSSIAAACRSRSDHYTTPELNSVLRLSYQSYRSIDCLQLFPSLTTLYLDHNSIGSDSLPALPACLHSVFLHSNRLTSLQSLPSMPQLRSLNVSDNGIVSLSGLERCPVLVTLDASHNALSASSLSSLSSLPLIRDLLLQHNAVDASSSLLPLLSSLPALRVLSLKGNAVVETSRAYRREVVSACTGLTFLDERKVGEEERRGVEGWAKGGLEGERAARQQLQTERREREQRQFDQWQQARQQRQQQQQPAQKQVSYSHSAYHKSSGREEEEAEQENTMQRPLSLTDSGLGKEDSDAIDTVISPAATAETAAAGASSDEFDITRSLSIEQYYARVQASVPSAVSSTLDSDSDSDSETAAGSEDGAAVPFLFGLTPVLHAAEAESGHSRVSSFSLPSVTASPLSASSPSELSPRAVRVDGGVMAALVCTLGRGREDTEAEEKEADKTGSAYDSSVQTVMAMLSAEMRSPGRRHETQHRSTLTVSEEEEDGSEEAEADIQWVEFNISHSSDEEEEADS